MAEGELQARLQQLDHELEVSHTRSQSRNVWLTIVFIDRKEKLLKKGKRMSLYIRERQLTQT